MADFFISYQRKSQDFVRQLQQSLIDANKTVWVDLEDIPKAADWFDEIRRGIEAAPSFVFVITLLSLTSEVCTRELAHARSLNKQIIPVVRELDPAEVEESLQGLAWSNQAVSNWQLLKSLNWIYMREAEDYQRSLVDLISTSETDLDVERLRARLTVRAREWQSKGKNTSYVLRGLDLSEAESWLGQAAPSSRPPTEEQVTYITSSRKAASARQRTIIGSLLFGIVVALLLAAAALIGFQQATVNEQLANHNAATATNAQGQAINNAQTAVSNALTATVAQGQAINNAQTAVANANRSESQRMAALASGLLEVPGGNVELAALLAIRGLKTGYSSQADQALLMASPRLYTHSMFTAPPDSLTGYADSVYAFQQTSDGHFLIHFDDLNSSAEDQGEVWSYDPSGASSGTPISTLTYGSHSSASKVVFSPDGKTVLTLQLDASLILWDSATGKSLWEQDTLGLDGNAAIGFAPDGNMVAAVTKGEAILLLDARTGNTIRSLHGHTLIVNQIAFSQDGKHLASASLDGTGRLWDVATGRELKSFQENCEFVSAALAPDGKTFVTGCKTITPLQPDNALHFWNVSSGQVTQTLADQKQPVTAITFSKDGKTMSTGDDTGTIRLWDMATGNLITILTGHRDTISELAFLDNGSLASLSSDSTLRVWAMQPVGSQLQSAYFRNDKHPIAVSANGGAILVAYFDPQGKGNEWSAQIVSTEGGEQNTLFKGIASSIVGGAFSSDDALVIGGASMLKGTAILWDVVSGSPRWQINADSIGVNAEQFSPDNQFVATGGADGVMRLWKVSTGDKIREFNLPPNQAGQTVAVVSIAFSRDGKLIAAGGDDNVVHVFDAATGNAVQALTGHKSDVLAVAFSPDGKLLASAEGNPSDNLSVTTGDGDSPDFAIHLWDVEKGTEIAQLTGHTNNVNSLAFSPDGKWLVSGSDDRSAVIWDLASGDAVRKITVHTGKVKLVGFSSNGSTIVSASDAGELFTWPADYHSLIANVCKQVFMDFSKGISRDEWQEFGISLPTKTCS
jgi:WD40 repeat protein